MAEIERKQDAPAAAGDELVTEDTPSEPTRSAGSDAVPSTPGGKGTATEEQIAGRADDTITDGDGSYLEPPD
jgi:hypothetical protein